MPANPNDRLLCSSNNNNNNNETKSDSSGDEEHTGFEPLFIDGEDFDVDELTKFIEDSALMGSDDVDSLKHDMSHFKSTNKDGSSSQQNLCDLPSHLTEVTEANEESNWMSGTNEGTKKLTNELAGFNSNSSIEKFRLDDNDHHRENEIFPQNSKNYYHHPTIIQKNNNNHWTSNPTPTFQPITTPKNSYEQNFSVALEKLYQSMKNSEYSRSMVEQLSRKCSRRHSLDPNILQTRKQLQAACIERTTTTNPMTSPSRNIGGPMRTCRRRSLVEKNIMTQLQQNGNRMTGNFRKEQLQLFKEQKRLANVQQRRMSWTKINT